MNSQSDDVLFRMKISLRNGVSDLIDFGLKDHANNVARSFVEVCICNMYHLYDYISFVMFSCVC